MGWGGFHVQPNCSVEVKVVRCRWGCDKRFVPFIDTRYSAHGFNTNIDFEKFALRSKILAEIYPNLAHQA